MVRTTGVCDGEREREWGKGKPYISAKISSVWYTTPFERGKRCGAATFCEDSFRDSFMFLPDTLQIFVKVWSHAWDISCQRKPCFVNCGVHGTRSTMENSHGTYLFSFCTLHVTSFIVFRGHGKLIWCIVCVVCQFPLCWGLLASIVDWLHA
jgi:hypothetical protein